MTSEQLELARAERMRQNGHGALTLEDARTWLEETGLCLFLPKRQFSASLAPSFVEAIAGQRNSTPDAKQIAAAEELLIRLELEGVAVRLNLLGQPGEQPDYVVAAWVLPYVYALRGDRDWRRSPQLTGSRQVSPLAIQAYKRLESGDSTIAELKEVLGQGVSEMAVLRAITELWQQLRIIPVVAARGEAARWQLLRQRFQKAIAEGASTSQVTAISVLASIFLQAVIAGTMEEVELFLSPLTARSKIREVLRGLVATRQVHTLSLGHAPHFYVAGTLPEFSVATTVFASAAFAGSSYFAHLEEREESLPEPAHSSPEPEPEGEPLETAAAHSAPAHHSASAVRKPSSSGKANGARPHFSRPAAHARDRKPAPASNGARSARRPAEGRSNGRPAPAGRASAAAGRNGHATAHKNGSSNGHASNGHASNGHAGNGHASNGHAAHTAGGAKSSKSAPPTWAKRSSARPAAASKPGSSSRNATLTRGTATARKDARPAARTAQSSRKPALATGSGAGGSKRFGFSSKQGSKKRG